MKRFVASCKDNATGMEMILSECSYNSACHYLTSIGFEKEEGAIHIKEDYRTGRTLIFHENENGNPIGRVYVYDEPRGYLLGS